MTTAIKNALSLFTLVVFFILAIASSGTKNINFTEGKQIPPGFNKFTGTLLVISDSHDRYYNKYLKKNFEENYTGDYKIISEKEMKDYPEDKYNYIFNHSTNYATKTTVGGAFDGKSSTYASSDVFFITDRKTKTDYVTKSSAYYSKLMRAYIKALDAARQK